MNICMIGLCEDVEPKDCWSLLIYFMNDMIRVCLSNTQQYRQKKNIKK
jgi:hypothetical protein